MAEQAKLDAELRDGDDDKPAATWIEIVYSTVVESLSTADFITDYLVLRSFINAKNGGEKWWSSWMILFMIANGRY